MPLLKPDNKNKYAKAIAGYLAREGINAHVAASRLKVRHQRVYTWLNHGSLPGRAEAERIGQMIGVTGLGDTVARLRRRRQACAGAV